MKGQKGRIDNPGAVISTGMYMGLVALVRITRDRTNKKTKKFYLSIEKQWAAARKALTEMTSLDKIGFSPIQTSESNMRGQHLKLSFTSLKRFGNRERKRVYSWLEGTVGHFNALLNYAGARLRELAMILYPFPKPQAFQIREYPNGSIKALTKIQSEETGYDGAVKTYWRHGYERTGKTPRMFLTHPTLPAMDFVDMIRAHCVELCRQCFIYHVPMTEAHRYIRRFIHRLKPFLDWVYTDGQEGRRGFNPYSDQELRKIVLEIQSLYSKRSRTRKRISDRRGESSISLTYETIRKTVIEQLAGTTDDFEREALLTFLDYFDTATVPEKEGTEKVIERIHEEISQRLAKSKDKDELKALTKLQRIIKTSSPEDKDGKTLLERIREKIIRLVSKATDPTESKHLVDLLDYLDVHEGVIQNRDIEKLTEQVLALTQREGNEWHRVLFSDLHHPISLRQVVFAGDKMLDSLSSIMVVTELPVARRSGKVDLTIFVRRVVEGLILWTPVMILEVKTKTAFDFNLFGFRLKRKREQVSTPAFYAWKRTMTDDEWNEILSSGPDGKALSQLEDYERELLAEYEQLVPQDTVPLKSLWKGVIVLDSSQSPMECYHTFQYLLEDLMTGFIHQLVEQETIISVIPDPLSSGEDTPKIAMFIAPSEGPAAILSKMEPPTSLSIEDPFNKREPDDRTLTLYVSISSPTSSGVTAARLSRNWHLLHHIKECLATSRTTIEVVWLDLMGNYKSSILVRKRMGLDTLLSERLISRETHQSLFNTLRKINFVDMSTFSDEIVSGGADAIDGLIQHIKTVLPDREDFDRIIILDGWVDLREMASGLHQHQLRILEQRLLDALPQSDVNIIWIDTGTPHTKMNSHYQRKCIRPLRFDSPRKTHLDEVIYNIPSSPWRFGWMSPQQEDVRVIVQDTPTQATPWRVAIHVPQLIGFAEKFKGLARRDGIVPPEVVAQNHIADHPMHGRSVTLSSTYMSHDIFTGDSLSMLDNALTLVPSVLRQRTPIDDDEQEVPPPAKEVLWQTAIQTVSSSGGSPIRGRIRVDTTRPPPQPRGTKRYFDTLTSLKDGEVTRPWSYHRTPKQLPDEDEEKTYVSTYVPDVIRTEVGTVDTLRTRRLELRRLYYAARYLKDQRPISKKLSDCCKKIEQFCKSQFKSIQNYPSLNTSEFFLKALYKIKDIILEDSQRTAVWNTLLLLRQKLPELLNSENRKILKDVLDENPEIFTLYGNNLFIAVLAALDKSSISLTEPLWNSVAEWTFHQIGMNVQEEKLRAVYSFQAILSNLRSRVKILSQLNFPEKFLGEEKIGAIIWQGDEYPFAALILIPHEGGYLTGLVNDLIFKRLPGTWSKCVTPPQRLMEFAQEYQPSPDSLPVIMRTVEETQVLWIPWNDEDEQEVYWDSFIIKHGKPAGRWNVIPWLKLEHVPLAVPLHIPELPDSVGSILDKMAMIKRESIQVKLEVWTDQEVYKVDLEGESFNERLEFSRTRELVRFLRTPIWSGTGYRSQSQRKTLMWNHRRDISYENKVSFLIPMVHRSRFYPDEYQYPETCKDCFGMNPGPELTMVIKESNDRCRLELKDLPSTSSLNWLEETEFTKSDLVLLMECEELFDTDSGIRYSVRLDVSEVVDITFHEIIENARLSEAFQAARENKYCEFESSQDDVGHEEEEYSTEVEDHEEEYSEEVEEHEEEKIPLMYEGHVFTHTGTEVETVGRRTEVVVVSLESDKGESTEIDAIQNVKKHKDDTQYAGAISPEGVQIEVTESLSPYGLDDDVLEGIIDAVRKALEEEGVRFLEE